MRPEHQHAPEQAPRVGFRPVQNGHVQNLRRALEQVQRLRERRPVGGHADFADSEQEIGVGQRRRRHRARVRRTLHASTDQRRVGVVARHTA